MYSTRRVILHVVILYYTAGTETRAPTPIRLTELWPRRYLRKRTERGSNTYCN